MDLKEIERLIKLCRKTGVSSVTVDGVTLTLSPQAPPSSYKRRAKSAPNPFEKALSEAKDAATKAKLKFMSEKHERDEAKKEDVDVNGAPNEYDMLFWSVGNSDGAQ